MTELTEHREYLRGCPRDRRSIGRHSQRVYVHNGIRYLLDRTLDATSPFFTLIRFTDKALLGKEIEINNERYWGGGWSWKRAVAAAQAELSGLGVLPVEWPPKPETGA